LATHQKQKKKTKKPAEGTKEREAHGSNSWETKQNQQRKGKKERKKKHPRKKLRLSTPHNIIDNYYYYLHTQRNTHE
jgi:hypothetical protein